jgi:hypothetical protein
MHLLVMEMAMCVLSFTYTIKTLAIKTLGAN